MKGCGFCVSLLVGCGLVAANCSLRADIYVALTVVSAFSMAPAPRIGVAFSKPVSSSTATNLANYTLLATNSTITGAELMPDQTTVALFLTEPVLDGSSLVVSGVAASDGSGTNLTASVAVNDFGFGLESFQIGAIARPGLYVTPNGLDFDVTTTASGVGGTADSASLVGRSGRGRMMSWSITPLAASDNRWAQAGMMVRESLTPGSRNLFVSVTVTNGLARLGVTYRQAQDGPTLSWPGDIAMLLGTSVSMRISRDECPDAFTLSATASDGAKVSVQLPDDYADTIYWGLATAGEGAQPAAPAFVSYRQLSIAVGDVFPQGIQFTRDGNNLTLTWNNWCHTVLQVSDRVDGVWETLLGAISPSTIPISGTRRFFRLQTMPSSEL